MKKSVSEIQQHTLGLFFHYIIVEIQHEELWKL